MGFTLRDNFPVPLGDKERDCFVTFDFTPAIPATESTPPVDAKIVIEKIELVDIRNMNFGFKHCKNKGVVFRLDVSEWLDHDYIGFFLNQKLQDYTEACSNG